VGDSSDNIAGLDGVGPKTAAEWLKSYHNLEGIIANCGKLNPKRFQNIVYTSVELLYKNRAMTILKRRELPPALRTAGALDATALVAELEAYEMKSTSAEAQKRYGAAV
jgi:DNA polymerase I